jgi:hypothetical protein
MPISILFSNSPFLTIAKIEDGVEVSNSTPDLLINESHNWPVQVTENPVEVGSPVTDHKYVVPKEYSVTVEYSNQPISITEVAGKADRVTTAVEFFENLVDRATIVNISTKHKDYESLICTGVNIGRNSTSGDSQQITANFKEFRTVSTESITVDRIEPTDASNSTSLTKTGKQTTSPSEPSVAAQEGAPQGSFLSRLTGLGG